MASNQADLFSASSVNVSEMGQPKDLASVEELVASIVKSGFDPTQIGRALLTQVRGGRYDVERAAALAGTITRALNKSREMNQPPTNEDLRP